MTAPHIFDVGFVLEHRYELRRRLGRGGLATTFLAWDRLRESEMALKLLYERTSEHLSFLRQEFSTLRTLTHPNLLQVFDFGLCSVAHGERAAYYTAELIDGLHLDAYAQDKKWDEVIKPIVDSISALGFLHRIGVAHGDFKPENILVTPQGKGALIDLSCASPLGIGGQQLCGTPGFIAPERLSGGPPTPGSDLYAVGVTVEMLIRHLSSPPPTAALEVVDRLVADAPERPTDCDEVLQVLGDRPLPWAGSVGRAMPLVGRDAPLETFRAALANLAQHRPGPRILQVVGSDGMGRTRLLSEMKWEAHFSSDVAEANVLSPRALVDLLRRITDEPSLADHLEGLLEARRVLNQASRPLVIVVDDVHLLSESQLALLVTFCRSIEAGDRYLLLCAGRRKISELEVEGSGVFVTLELEPLRRKDILEMAGDGTALTQGAVKTIETLTGGLPGQVELLLEDVSTCADDAALERAARTRLAAFEGIQGYVTLSDEAQRALTLLALMGGRADKADLGELGVADDVLSALRPWCVRDGSLWRLARAGLEPKILETLTPEQRSKGHADLARWLENKVRRPAGSRLPGDAGVIARLVVHVNGSGRRNDAEALFLKFATHHRSCPDLFERAAFALLESGPVSLDVVLAAADLAELVGSPDRALEALDRGNRSIESDSHGEVNVKQSWASQIALRRGASYLKRGDAHRALTLLDEIAPKIEDSKSLARLADLRARAHIQIANYGEARATAEGAMDGCIDPEVLADLRLDAGLAASFLGDLEGAHEHFRLVPHHSELMRDDPQRAIRALSYIAHNEHRLGKSKEAIEGFRNALKIAESEGLGIQVANAALNLGTACHQIGDLGQALSAYERGARAARALAMVSTEVSLVYNTALLYFDIGLVERALNSANRALTSASRTGMKFLHSAALLLLGEIALERGRDSEAKRLLSAAKEGFEKESAVREVGETDLRLAELELRSNHEGALPLVENALEVARRLGAVDLEAQSLYVAAQSFARVHDRARAVELFEAALQKSKDAGKWLLQAEVEGALSSAFREMDAPMLESRHRDQALMLYERMAASLPERFSPSFWSYRERGALRETRPSRTTTPRRDDDLLRRLIAINGKLSSSLDTDEILKMTMDAAIELTRAERGFVLLRAAENDLPSISVAAARNIDREQITRSHLKFSHGVAEGVLSSGEPVLTLDAESDERFEGNPSIHAMRLKSILCVPIRTARGVVGALYLDNRFLPGRFSEAELECLVSFADQVAIALDNARLHEALEARTSDLERRTIELERERRKVRALVTRQAEEIGRLGRALDEKHVSENYRFDYGRIIGRSRRMREILSLLDRVIDTSLTVLIQGESGTGKELIAKTIHDNSSRQDKPFVAINCAALPESLLEAELFGHSKGAFTGAVENRRGVVAMAHGGTLFLDEVGEMPTVMQAKMLRVIQEREVTPLGSSRANHVDVRFVCATNRNLADEVRTGNFREDLYYRLAVAEIWLPPLRERREDIPALAMAFLERIAKGMNRKAPHLKPDALRSLTTHPLAGNVRQLENVLTKAILLLDGDELGAELLELPTGATLVAARSGLDRAQQEEAELRYALALHKHNVTRAAKELGISRPTLYKRMKRYGLMRSRS